MILSRVEEKTNSNPRDRELRREDDGGNPGEAKLAGSNRFERGNKGGGVGMRGGLRHEGEGIASTSRAKGGAGPKELEAGGELEGVTGVPDAGVKESRGDPGNAGSKKGQERAGDVIRANAREEKVAIIGTERQPRVNRLNGCGRSPVL
jgi:hypothetical protein